MNATDLNLTPLRDVAHEVGVSGSTINKWLQEKKIDGTRIGVLWYFTPRQIRDTQAYYSRIANDPKYQRLVANATRARHTMQQRRNGETPPSAPPPAPPETPDDSHLGKIGRKLSSMAAYSEASVDVLRDIQTKLGDIAGQLASLTEAVLSVATAPKSS